MYGVVKTSEQQLGRNEGSKERRTHGRSENVRSEGRTGKEWMRTDDEGNPVPGPASMTGQGGHAIGYGSLVSFQNCISSGHAGASQDAVPERHVSSGSAHRLSMANGRGRGALESRRCRCCRVLSSRSAVDSLCVHRRQRRLSVLSSRSVTQIVHGFSCLHHASITLTSA
jgi:hypothetical protein